MGNGLETCQVGEVRLSISRTVQLREYHPVTMKVDITLIPSEESDTDSIIDEGYAYLEEKLDANMNAYLTKLQSGNPTRPGMSPGKSQGSPLRRPVE